MTIRFNEQDLPSFVVVTKVQRGLAPPVSQTTVQIPGRAGSYDFGNQIGDRSIKIDYTILANDEADLIQKADQFIQWLYTEDPAKLVILDDPNRYFLAKLSGNTDFDEMYRVGQGTIEFYCADPFRYQDEIPIDFSPVSSDPITVTNDGMFRAYPRFELTFNQDSTEFGIVHNDKYIYFGAPAYVDQPAPQKKDILRIDDNCSSLNGWTSASSVDGGTITGQLESLGNLIRQQNYDYGSGSTWHGGSMVKMFSGGNYQDFTVEVTLGFKSGYPNQTGRIEIYLLDTNGVKIGKMAIRDSDRSMENPFVEARAGASNGTYFVNTNVKKSYFAQFYGILRIKRTGNVWEFFAAKKDTKGKLYNIYVQKFTDKNNLYSTPLSGIQIHFAAYGSYSTVSTMYLEHIEIWENNVIVDPTVTPIIFNSGDKLIIDSETGSVTLNGEPFFYAIDPASDFPILEVGDNQIQAAPPIVTGQLYVKKRWL